jgi:putative transposase
VKNGFKVRTKRRKKLIRPRIPMHVPDAVNQRWSIDFMSDQLANGQRFRILNIVDDCSRECVLQIVDFSISGQRLAHELGQLARQLPDTIVCDNGPEFTCKAMFCWAKQAGVKLHFI